MLKQSRSAASSLIAVGCIGFLLLEAGCQKAEVVVGGPITNNVSPSSRIHLQGVALSRAIETYRALVGSAISVEVPAEVLQKPISAGPFSSAADDAALLLEASFREQAQVTTTRDADGRILLRYEPTLAQQK